MKITNVGYNYRHSREFQIQRPNGSGDCILLIIKTEAFVFFGGKREIVPPNSVILFKKGTPQMYGAIGNEYVNDWIHFDADAEDERLISDLGIPFDTVIPLQDATELLGFIKNIFFELYSQNLHKTASMERYFELILLKLSEKIKQHNTEREHPYYAPFCKLRGELCLAPQRAWTVDEICKTINLSRSYVQHLYKHFFGESLVSDLRRCRMEHAKYLLSATDMTVTRISESCGYENDVHFMRIFKKETGMTPSEYRRSFRVSQNEIEMAKTRPPFSM